MNSVNEKSAADGLPPGVVAYHGELTHRKHLLGRGAAFLAPGFLWVTIFLALPCLALFAVSFAQRGTYGDVDWTFSLENLKRLMGYGLFGWSPDNLLVLGRSIVVAVVTTALCALLSYPLAFFIAARPKRTRTMWLTLVLVPFWTNLVIRTYAWLLVLAPQMPLARLCVRLGLIGPGEALYPSAFAVYLGMISTFLPFVVLPLYASVEKLNWSLVEAVQDLYGGPVRTFIHAVLPQTMPGLSVGITLTLIPAMGMFVVPDMLSGARYMLVGNLIQQQFGTSRDWPFGAMVSLSLMLLTLVTLFLLNARHFRNKEEGRP
jgi:spermidine/putrescine transport system permease protein